jgi:hypothetical protein
MGVAGAITLSGLAMRCAAFETADAPSDAGPDGGGGAITDASSTRDSSLANLPDGAIVWSGNGHGYLFVPKVGITWDEASAESQDAGGHLVTLSSAEENDFVFREVLGANLDASFHPADNTYGLHFWGPWLGAERIPDSGGADARYAWTWTDAAEPFTYADWFLPSEPSDQSGVSETRAFYYSHDAAPTGAWADIEPTGTGVVSGYVVEFE